jgi:thiosulfate/3-mercaptopyruvate sulfurtransferase
MKTSKNNLFAFFLLAIVSIAFQSANAAEPWTSNQLMAPAELNKILNNSKASQPVIFSIGFQDIIKNSIDIGPGRDKESIKKLKQHLSKLSKDSFIVIYCGCCPFDKCPNVRPVFNLLNEMGFKNHKLLNLPQNIKVDWIDKGYAVKK